MINYRRTELRAECKVHCLCYADPQLFLPWENLTPAVKREFQVNGPLPCEGGGVPGEWCGECRFGSVQSIDGSYERH